MLIFWPEFRLLPLLLAPEVMVSLPALLVPIPPSCVGPAPLLNRLVAGGVPSVPMKSRFDPEPSLLSTETYSVLLYIWTSRVSWLRVLLVVSSPVIAVGAVLGVPTSV